jgi:hypothetical protein
MTINKGSVPFVPPGECGGRIGRYSNRQVQRGNEHVDSPKGIIEKTERCKLFTFLGLRILKV